MFRKTRASQEGNELPVPANTADTLDREWAQIDDLLERRPLPTRIPDVRSAVLARIQSEPVRTAGWRRWIFRPAFAASAWGLAGMAAGLLFIVLIASRIPAETYADPELIAEPLLTDDVVTITQLAELPEGSTRP